MKYKALLVIAVLGVGGCSSAARSNSLRAQRAVPVMERQIQNAVDAGDGDYQAKRLRARVDANPLDVTARLELARHYQRAGFPEIAIEHGKLACERVPESEAAHIGLAQLLNENGRSAEALSGLENYATGHEAGVDVLIWLGLLRDESGNLIGAEAAHRKALALGPDRDDLHNNLGFSLLHLGRRNEAAAEFRTALTLNPRSVTARNNLGEALASDPAGDHREAVLNWQSVADPASAHNNMAAVLISTGKYEEARKELSTALGYDRHHAPALRNLGLLAELDGKAPEVPLEPKRNSVAKFRSAWVHYWIGKNTVNSSRASIEAHKRRQATPKS